MPSLVGKRQALAAFREAFKELGGKRYDNVQVGIIQDELRIFRMYNSDGDGGEITQAQAANIFDLLIEVVKEWKQISDPMHQLFDTEDLAILLFEEIFSNKARSAGWEA